MMRSSTIELTLKRIVAGLALAVVVDLALDALDEPGAHRVRRHQQALVVGGERVAGQDVEELADVVADGGARR